MLPFVQHTLTKILSRQVRVYRGLATSEEERREADAMERWLARADAELTANKRPQPRAVNFARGRREEKK